MDETRRNLLKATAALLVDQWAGARLGALANEPSGGVGGKVVLVACGGIRREDTFAESGFHNIPHLYRDLLPQSAFFPFVRNAGVTSHYNTTSSIISGNWQRVDD